ncbi:hypothetical protein BS47DRAFT_365007 [Hydnum rufescens UP504]|uniref:Uncharacterized protein n=1 Tax=Hydnum rufescens UP504 TaxID=1448309 RepID=A0A9P6ALC4_9AGAM|nr:hypothetical protein BS47DRAFT_365007 [Hydnum rufescens UP504]
MSLCEIRVSSPRGRSFLARNGVSNKDALLRVGNTTFFNTRTKSIVYCRQTLTFSDRFNIADIKTLNISVGIAVCLDFEPALLWTRSDSSRNFLYEVCVSSLCNVECRTTLAGATFPGIATTGSGHSV